VRHQIVKLFRSNVNPAHKSVQSSSESIATSEHVPRIGLHLLLLAVEYWLVTLSSSSSLSLVP
jgi:hypothetical protein